MLKIKPASQLKRQKTHFFSLYSAKWSYNNQRLSTVTRVFQIHVGSQHQ